MGSGERREEAAIAELNPSPPGIIIHIIDVHTEFLLKGVFFLKNLHVISLVYRLTPTLSVAVEQGE